MTDNMHAEGVAPETRPPSGDLGRRLVVTPGSHVKAKRLVWWELGLILQYAINLLAAREGKGKSTVASSWAARETRNGGVVLWIGTEESREHAIVPRLIANGADMDRVIFVDVQTDLGTGALMFPLDLLAIEKVIRDHGVTMVFLDPAKAVVPPGFSGNDDIAVRQYLEPIAALADRCKVTIIGLAHFGKRQGTDSGQLMLGSVAWSQVARCVLSIAENPDTGTRVLTNTKANYVGTDRSVEFRIMSTTIDTDDGPTEIGSVEWLGDTTTDARDLLAGNLDDDAHEIDRWLTDLLANGSVKATEVFSAADAAGFSKDQAKRSKKRLAIKAERNDFGGPWFWSLPVTDPKGADTKGAPPSRTEALPSLPSRSEGVQETEVSHREHSDGDRSLRAPKPSAMPSRGSHAALITGTRRRRTRGGNRCACGAALERAESIHRGQCAECALLSKHETVS